MADLDGFTHVALQIALLMHDFHRTAAQHVAGAHHQWVAKRAGFFQRFRLGTRCGIRWLLQSQLAQQCRETLAVFSCVNHVGRGADDGHAVGFQIKRQLQRRLTAVLHDHAKWLFFVNNFQHVFERQRLKVQAV